MHPLINKKIFLYIFFFILFGSINNQSFLKSNFLEIDDFKIYGLDEQNYISIEKKLRGLNFRNIFFINKKDIEKILNSYDIIDNYSITKKYPSSLEIRISKAKFLANTIIDGEIFFFGSNGKFIESDQLDKNLPIVFGKTSLKNFLDIKRKIDDSIIKYENIESLFFFPVGRWDIKLKNGVLLKLPTKNVVSALDISNKILSSDNFKKIEIVDLRISNQIIINE